MPKKSKFKVSCANCKMLRHPCCEIHRRMTDLMVSLDRIEREQKMSTRYRAFQGAFTVTGESRGCS